MAQNSSSRRYERRAHPPQSAVSATRASTAKKLESNFSSLTQTLLFESCELGGKVRRRGQHLFGLPLEPWPGVAESAPPARLE